MDNGAGAGCLLGAMTAGGGGRTGGGVCVVYSGGTNLWRTGAGSASGWGCTQPVRDALRIALHETPLLTIWPREVGCLTLRVVTTRHPRNNYASEMTESCMQIRTHLAVCELGFVSRGLVLECNQSMRDASYTFHRLVAACTSARKNVTTRSGSVHGGCSSCCTAGKD
eukprot:6188970-Pleurochrysis_carterae.AAC.1